MFFIIYCIFFEAFELTDLLIKTYQFGMGNNKLLFFVILFWVYIDIHLFKKYKTKDFL